ncbi:MAG TPA: glycosyltransferase [Actinobacteria bacterium]|nr:N-acetylgalactosamine-N, N'-diacetylbacillosaminyl-diphospho-undecaprenol4-alpha-N-acetylgalactosaminyltransferase [bacterium BMS3Bbin01]HDH26696.1 glycosyltransferase [Actinomycetota bacterium]
MTPHTSASEDTAAARTVSLLMASFEGGGAERVTTQLAAAFQTRGVDTELVVVRPSGPLRTWAQDLLAPRSIVDINGRRLRTSIIGIRRYLRVRHPDVLIAGPDDVAIAALIALRLARLKSTLLVGVVHSTLSTRNRNLRSNGKLSMLADRLLLPKMDLVVAVSEGAAEDLKERIGLPTGMVVTIPNPVDVIGVRSLAERGVSHPWVDANLPIILAVGRLAPPKDFATLLRAFVLVKQAMSTTKLLILGEGPQRSDLEAMIVKHGLGDDVELLGFVDNPWAFMARSAVFVLSSEWEGFALVVAEALACGVPVVATDCPSGPREILKHGELGALVPVGDAELMASAIVRSLREPPPPADPEYLIGRYAPDSVAGRYLAAMDSLFSASATD